MQRVGVVVCIFIIASFLVMYFVEVRVQTQGPVAIEIPELQTAIINGASIGEITAIIERDPQAVNRDFQFTGTALDRAIAFRRRQVVELLIRNGADVDHAMKRLKARGDGDDEGIAFLRGVLQNVEPKKNHE